MRFGGVPLLISGLFPPGPHQPRDHFRKGIGKKGDAEGKKKLFHLENIPFIRRTVNQEELSRELSRLSGCSRVGGDRSGSSA